MGGQIVLVVEDEVIIRMMTADALRDEGYEVVEAANGDEGMTILHSAHEISLIITDVRMPGRIDGMQLTAHSKRLHPNRPVLVVSAHLPPRSAHSADEFLPKPYTPSTLLSVIDRLIGPPGLDRTFNCTG